MAKDKSGSVESDLDRMALEEIMKETKRGKERAETMGPMGWLKCPLVPTNKRFFRNVLMGTLSNQNQNNRMKDFQQDHGCSAKHRSNNSSSPSNSSSRDKNIVAKKQDKSERTGHSYSSRKYSNETTSNGGKNSKEKYKQIKDDGLGKGSHLSHSRHTDRSHRRNYCDKKAHTETNQSRKHKIEEHKKELKQDKRVKKRKS